MPGPAPREELPMFVPPMLAAAGEAPADDAWAVSLKWDGIRAQLRVDGDQLTFRSRPGHDRSAEFAPELRRLASHLGGRHLLLDGELVCLDAEGRPDFTRVRARLAGQRAGNGRPACTATFMVFDALHMNGQSTRQLPFAERHELLQQLELEGPVCRVPPVFTGADADALIRATRDARLEGVVAKHLDSPYLPGDRHPTRWIKQKHRISEWMTVTGWVADEAGRPREYLLARTADDGSLRPAGRAAYGLDESARRTLHRRLAELELPHTRRRAIRRVRPVFQVQVDYHGAATGPVRDPLLRALRSSA